MSYPMKVEKLPVFPKILFLAVIISVLVVLPAITALYMKYSDVLQIQIIYLVLLFFVLILQIVNTYKYSGVLVVPCIIMCAFIFGTAIPIVLYDKLQDKKETLLWSYIPIIIFFHIITLEITQAILKKYLGQATQKAMNFIYNVPPVGHAHSTLGYVPDINTIKPKK